MKYFIYAILFLTTSSFTLKDQMSKGKVGEYIVMEQGKMMSMLILRSVTDEDLILEEISTSQKPKTSWAEWVKTNSSNATSWTQFTLDRTTCKLKSMYSVLQKRWVTLDESEIFLAQLLALPLTKLDSSQRKKIGPAPSGEELDKRALWSPPQYINGKKIDKPHLEVYRATWPKDKSLISECQIELYFDKSFPFPYWVEVKSTHYKVKMHTIDSGKL